MRKARSAGLIIDVPNEAVLVIKRYFRGRNYASLPGGKMQAEESPEDACVREVLEETGLTVTIKEKILVMVNLDRLEHYYLIDRFSGTVSLGGPEKDHQTADNTYEPRWIPISQMAEFNLLPLRIRRVCLEYLQELKAGQP